ncbi:MAG: tRNA (guanine(46)-N(7))-methyltransferase TrmB [Parahaliea sp.]
MQAISRPVYSSQPFIHPQLGRVVERHLAAPSRRPLASYNRQAFSALQTLQSQHLRPLVLDSFCGTGYSTALLAERHPQHLVVGIDKSAHRLNKHITASCDNYLLLRAECEAIWQLVLAAQWPVGFHYLFYPNPWPKPAHFKRRIHGDAAFPYLVQLGGKVELRSNWQSYVEEFGLAMGIAGINGTVSQCPDNEPQHSLFEHKYRASGHSLWRYRNYPNKYSPL